MSEDETQQSKDARAEEFFDTKILPQLRDEFGQPEALIAAQRETFVDLVLGARDELAGYRPSEAAVHRWDTSVKFMVADGEMGLAAELALHRAGIRRDMQTEGFRYACYVGAPSATIAQQCALDTLLDLLRPYGLGIFVFDARQVKLP